MLEEIVEYKKELFFSTSTVDNHKWCTGVQLLETNNNILCQHLSTILFNNFQVKTAIFCQVKENYHFCLVTQGRVKKDLIPILRSVIDIYMTGYFNGVNNSYEN